MPSWSVPREWVGATAFVIAGGPSVTQADVDRLRGGHVIAINKSYERAPWAEYWISHDPGDWHDHCAGLARVGFAGKRVTCQKAIRAAGVLQLARLTPPPFLSLKPTHLAMQRTTVTAALNLAFLLGATTIVVLGADMRAADDGRTHHHSPYPYQPKPGCWDRQMVELQQVAAALAAQGVAVLNCSPISRITFWPKVSLDDVLAGIAA